MMVRHRSSTLSQEQVISSTPQGESCHLMATMKRWLGRSAVVIAATATSVASIVAIGGEIYADDHSRGFDLAYEYITQEQCDNASSDSIQEVNVYLAAPEDDRYDAIVESFGSSTSQFHYKKVDTALTAIARENNLEVIERAPYEEALQQSTNKEEVFAVLEDFLSNYDIKVSIAQTLGIKDLSFTNIHALDTDKIDPDTLLNQLKIATGNLIENFSPVPVELMKYPGAKEIKLVSKIEKDGRSFTGLAAYETGIIYLDITDLNPIDNKTKLVGLHEWAHLLDKKLCGTIGMNNDPIIPKITVDELLKERSSEQLWYGDPNVTYHDTGVSEIKADVFSLIVRGSYPKGESPEVVKNFTELTARIATIPHGKNILRYFSSIWDKDVFDRSTGENIIPVFSR